MRQTNGFKGGSVKIFLALRSEPTTQNYFRVFKISQSSITLDIVNFTLTFSDLLNKNIINQTYRRENFPGLF
jgi:hypothetical protein